MIDAVLFDLENTLVRIDITDPHTLLDAGFLPVYARLQSEGFRLPGFRTYARLLKVRLLTAVLWSKISRREVRIVDLFCRIHRGMGIPLSDDQALEIGSGCIPVFASRVSQDAQAVSTIRSLRKRGFRLGLVSNTFLPGFAIDDFLRLAGLLDYFPVRIYSSDVGYMKPNRRIFDLALQRLGVRGEQTMFVGDRVDKDVKGAARMGMHTVLLEKHAPRRWTRVRPDYSIRCLSEIPALLQKLVG